MTNVKLIDRIYCIVIYEKSMLDNPIYENWLKKLKLADISTSINKITKNQRSNSLITKWEYKSILDEEIEKINTIINKELLESNISFLEEIISFIHFSISNIQDEKAISSLSELIINIRASLDLFSEKNYSLELYCDTITSIESILVSNEKWNKDYIDSCKNTFYETLNNIIGNEEFNYEFKSILKERFSMIQELFLYWEESITKDDVNIINEHTQNINYLFKDNNKVNYLLNDINSELLSMIEKLWIKKGNE